MRNLERPLFPRTVVQHWSSKSKIVTEISHTPPIRRVVTGHAPSYVAQVLIDDSASNARSGAGTISTLIWCTDQMPVDIPVGIHVEDMGERVLGTAPPRNGTRFVIIDFAPGNTAQMHRTETLDYVVVLEGTIEMDMDDSVISLKAGDVLVQRGTNHAWANRSDKRARLAFVLIDAKPLGIGSPITGAAKPA